MFGIRRGQISWALVACLVLALAAVFSLGGIVHAIVPHSHGGSEMMWDELHAALRHESKSILLVASFTLWVGEVLPALLSTRLVLVPVLGRSARQLHRGIAKYRRFG